MLLTLQLSFSRCRHLGLTRVGVDQWLVRRRLRVLSATRMRLRLRLGTTGTRNEAGRTAHLAAPAGGEGAWLGPTIWPAGRGVEKWAFDGSQVHQRQLVLLALIATFLKYTRGRGGNQK